MILNAQTTKHALNISVAIPVKIPIHVAKVLSVKPKVIVLFANVHLDGVVIHQLSAFNVG